MARKRGQPPASAASVASPRNGRKAALPLRTKLLYATSSLGSEALTRSRSLWLVYFYAPPADSGLPKLLPTLVVGIVLTVGRILGALDEVVIGYFSDRTRSRWGRRIPYIVLGAPFWALFAFLLFTPPAHASNVATAVYLFFVLELFFLFGTVSGGPYEALLPEIAPTTRERVGLQAIKVYLGVAGSAVGLIGSDLLKDHIGFRGMALAIAGLALVCRYVGIAGAWERAKRSRHVAALPFREALRATFANVPFLVLLPTVVLFGISFELLQGVIPFYVHALLPKGSWLTVRVLTAVAIAAAVAFVPVFAALARRTSKREAYRMSMLAAATAFPLLALGGLLPAIPKEAQILCATAIVGAPIGAHFLFPVPLTADVIDHDSVSTRLRREATFFGSMSFVERTATSVAPLVLTLLLLLGNSRGNSLGIRLVGPAAGVIVLAGYLVFRRYDLPDQVEARIAPGEQA